MSPPTPIGPPPQAAHLLDRRVDLVLAPGRHHDVGPDLGEAEGDTPPDAAARAGDDGDLPVEAEAVEQPAHGLHRDGSGSHVRSSSTATSSIGLGFLAERWRADGPSARLYHRRRDEEAHMTQVEHERGLHADRSRGPRGPGDGLRGAAGRSARSTAAMTSARPLYSLSRRQRHRGGAARPRHLVEPLRGGHRAVDCRASATCSTTTRPSTSAAVSSPAPGSCRRRSHRSSRSCGRWPSRSSTPWRREAGPTSTPTSRCRCPSRASAPSWASRSATATSSSSGPTR